MVNVTLRPRIASSASPGNTTRRRWT